MHKMIVAVVDHSLLETICSALREENIHFTYWDVKGVDKEVRMSQSGRAYTRLRIEIIASSDDVGKVKRILRGLIPAGVPGAGIVAVYDLEEFTDFS